jgi:hypothetical protein
MDTQLDACCLLIHVAAIRVVSESGRSAVAQRQPLLIGHCSNVSNHLCCQEITFITCPCPYHLTNIFISLSPLPRQKDEGLNVEVKDPSPSPPSEDSNLDGDNDNTDIESAVLPNKGSKSGNKNIICSFLSKIEFRSPWLITIALAFVFVVGGAVVYRVSYSAAGNIQQQKSVSVANVGGKRGGRR